MSYSKLKVSKRVFSEVPVLILTCNSGYKVVRKYPKGNIPILTPIFEKSDQAGAWARENDYSPV